MLSPVALNKQATQIGYRGVTWYSIVIEINILSPTMTHEVTQQQQRGYVGYKFIIIHAWFLPFSNIGVTRTCSLCHSLTE